MKKIQANIKMAKKKGKNPLESMELNFRFVGAPGTGEGSGGAAAVAAGGCGGCGSMKALRVLWQSSDALSLSLLQARQLSPDEWGKCSSTWACCPLMRWWRSLLRTSPLATLVRAVPRL